MVILNGQALLFAACLFYKRELTDRLNHECLNLHQKHVSDLYHWRLHFRLTLYWNELKMQYAPTPRRRYLHCMKWAIDLCLNSLWPVSFPSVRWMKPRYRWPSGFSALPVPRSNCSNWTPIKLPMPFLAPPSRAKRHKPCWQLQPTRCSSQMEPCRQPVKDLPPSKA